MNRAEEQWEPVWVSTEIEEGVTYHAVMVLDASENDVFGDFDGRITGYLDGEEFETAEGADQLYGHGNNISIGSVENNTFFPDGSNPTNGAYFTGIIDEVAVYNSLLDDPDDDGDFSDSRVLDHFLAGSKGGGPERPQFRRGDGANVGSVNITSAINILNFLFSDTVNSLACHEAGDVNNDGDVNITDPVGLLNHLFGDGSPPKAPGLESCGPDPDEPGSPGDLGCEEYTSC